MKKKPQNLEPQINFKKCRQMAFMVIIGGM